MSPAITTLALISRLAIRRSIRQAYQTCHLRSRPSTKDVRKTGEASVLFRHKSVIDPF